MTMLTRRGTILGAPAAMAPGRTARAATPVRLGILTDMSGPYSEDAGPGSVVAAQLAIEDFARLHPGLKVTLLTAGAGAETDTYVSLAGFWYDRDGVDAIFGKGRVRQDGRKIHDMFLFEVKDPSESRYPWDYYRQLATIPAEEAFRPESEGGCTMVKA